MNRLIITTIIASLTLPAYAAPSRMRAIEVAQPDGTRLTVTAMGDENFRYYVSADSVMLQHDGTVFRYFGTALTAHNPEQRTDEESRLTASLRYSSVIMQLKHEAATTVSRPKATAIGAPHALVILVEFPDRPYSVEAAGEEYFAMLNAEGYDNYRHSGSVRDYFVASSACRYTPVFDVYGPVMMAHGFAYYGNDVGNSDAAPEEMVKEACLAIDNDVDFSIYDSNGDGEVDNVYIFYAGQGQADGGEVATIWPHSSTLTQNDEALTCDGVKIDSYGCSPELDGNKDVNGIGTFCHEYSHVLGLPDLYDTSYGGALTPGNWDLMARGNYLNDGRTPPLLSGYERYYLGWVEPKPITHPKNLRILPLADNDVYRISTERENEYFLLENRQKEGWDAFLPGHGMIVWHIDYNPNIWDRNVVNRNPSHQYVDIIEANHATTSNYEAGFAFPGTGNVTSLTEMKSWSGVDTNLPLTDITESAGIISLKVAGGKEDVEAPSLFEAEEITPTSVALRWSNSANAVTYNVYVNGMKTLTSINDTKIVVTSLDADTDYTFYVTAEDLYEESLPSNEVSARTLPPTFEMLIPENVRVRNITEGGFTVTWDAVAGAGGYYLTVAQRYRGEFVQSLCSFNDNVLPEGWTTTSTSFYSVDGYYGSSAPSLRLVDGDLLQSPIFDGDIRQLSFMARRTKSDSDIKIIISGDCNGKSVVLHEVTPTSVKGGETIAFDEKDGTIPEHCRQITLMAKDDGIIAIDDVTIAYGGVATDTPVSAYNHKDVGNTEMFDVMLNPIERRLVVMVQAYNDEGESSMWSQPIEVTKGAEGSVELLRSEGCEATELWTIDGRLIGNCRNIPAGIYIVKTPCGVRKIIVR